MLVQPSDSACSSRWPCIGGISLVAPSKAPSRQRFLLRTSGSRVRFPKSAAGVGINSRASALDMGTRLGIICIWITDRVVLKALRIRSSTRIHGYARMLKYLANVPHVGSWLWIVFGDFFAARMPPCGALFLEASTGVCGNQVVRGFSSIRPKRRRVR